MDANVSTGVLLWEHGAQMADVVVVVRGMGEEAMLRLHSLVLAQKSAFFATRLSPVWSTSQDTITQITTAHEDSAHDRVVLDVDLPTSVMQAALRLLYTDSFDKDVRDTQTAAELLAAFQFLAADSPIAWCCNFLVRECIRLNDSKTLRTLRDKYPLSPFFSESTGALSSAMTSPNPVLNNPKLLRSPTNSMTVQDLGLLIAKSSLKTGAKFLQFVATEIQENERLRFHASNGLALIHGFETFLMDIEKHRNKLVEEVLEDNERLEQFEDEDFSDGSNSSSNGSDNSDDWEDEPGAGAVGADRLNPPRRMHSPTDSLDRNRLRRRKERNIQLTKLRHILARRRAKRERQLALLKHNYILQSVRLFKLFHRALPLQKIIILDSWISTGHELFCNVVEIDNEKDNGQEDSIESIIFNDHEFDASDSEESDYDEFNVDDDFNDEEENDFNDRDSSLRVTDSERLILPDGSTASDMDDSESVVLDGGRGLNNTTTIVADESSTKDTAVHTEQTPHQQRRSTVTINEVISPAPLAGILAPHPVRAYTPHSSILTSDLAYQAATASNGSGTVPFKSPAQKPFDLSILATTKESNNSGGGSVSFRSPAEEAFELKTFDENSPMSVTPTRDIPAQSLSNVTTGSSPPPVPPVSLPPSTTIETASTAYPPAPILGSAFRSNPSSLSTSTTHLGFALKTKIKTTATSLVYGGDSSSVGGGAPSTSGSVSGRQQVTTPPPPMSPNRLRPRNKWGSISNNGDTSGFGGGGGFEGSSGSSRFYHSVKARVAAQVRLEKCLEFALAELSVLAGAGTLDEWIENGGGEDMKFSLQTRKDFTYDSGLFNSDDSDSDVSENERPAVNNNVANHHRNHHNRNRVTPNNILTDENIGSIAETYTSDIIKYAIAYNLPKNGGPTLINIFVCLFDILVAVAYRGPPSNTNTGFDSDRSNTCGYDSTSTPQSLTSPKHRHVSQASSHASHLSATTTATTAPLESTPSHPVYKPQSYAGFSYSPKLGDMSVRSGFSIVTNERLDGYVAEIVGGVRNVRMRQFLVKTVVVDHGDGVGRRTGRAIIEGMKGVNLGMKGKSVRLE
ncbi:hypothetical protein HK100_012293 [Physocladia obscura]|uniref:BTB domain-containing protein n=1 Tax=Physocladia obscura TaxID=109957 RepID=A0AAD5SZY6_9FUNG|nr:hypothetical protein HK100_012293 [Physocladia obscura]